MGRLGLAKALQGGERLVGAIGARGLLPGPFLSSCKSLTCSDAMRTGPNGRLRSLLRLTECSHHVGSSGLIDQNAAETDTADHPQPGLP